MAGKYDSEFKMAAPTCVLCGEDQLVTGRAPRYRHHLSKVPANTQNSKHRDSFKAYYRHIDERKFKIFDQKSSALKRVHIQTKSAERSSFFYLFPRLFIITSNCLCIKHSSPMSVSPPIDDWPTCWSVDGCLLVLGKNLVPSIKEDDLDDFSVWIVALWIDWLIVTCRSRVDPSRRSREDPPAAHRTYNTTRIDGLQTKTTENKDDSE